MDAEKYLREKRARIVSVTYCCVTNCPQTQLPKPPFTLRDSASRYFGLDSAGSLMRLQSAAGSAPGCLVLDVFSHMIGIMGGNGPHVSRVWKD